jgi:hypothetical protein
VGCRWPLRWSGCGERWGGSGTREEGSKRSGDGRTSEAARAGSERLGGSAAEGEREEGKCGGPGVGVPRGAGVPWGLALTGGRRPAAARARRLRATCAARTRADGTERGREGADGWAVTQCRAAVPLTGGADLSAGAGRARARVGWPEKKRGRAARMHSNVLHLFELV